MKKFVELIGLSNSNNETIIDLEYNLNNRWVAIIQCGDKRVYIDDYPYDEMVRSLQCKGFVFNIDDIVEL